MALTLHESRVLKQARPIITVSMLTCSALCGHYSLTQTVFYHYFKALSRVFKYFLDLRSNI